jgi:hypothetical protein
MGGDIFNNGLVEMNHVSLVFNRSLSVGSAGRGGGIYKHQTARPSASYLIARNTLISQNT